MSQGELLETPLPGALPHKLTLADADAAGVVMAQAFFNDPLIVYLWPDPAVRLRRTARFYATVTRLAIAAGQAYGVGDPLAGFAAWGWPGQSRTGAAAVLTSGALNLGLAPILPAFFRVGSVFSAFNAMRQRHAPLQHYYLETIGIAPAAQGRGYASQWIRPFLQQADARGLAAYTETATPSNVGLYDYFGFQVMERRDLVDKGLSLWSFLRQADRRA